MTWASVIHTADIAGFELLRDSRSEIRSKPWAEGPHREAMNLYFGIKRTHEEINRLNMEIKHLLTFMLDDHVDFYHAVGQTVMMNPFLAAELSREYERCCVIHTHISNRLYKTSQLEGFTGTLDRGRRLGSDDSLNYDVPHPSWLSILQVPRKYTVSSTPMPNQFDDESEDSDDEEIEENLGLMGELVDTLSV